MSLQSSQAAVGEQQNVPHKNLHLTLLLGAAWRPQKMAFIHRSRRRGTPALSTIWMR